MSKSISTEKRIKILSKTNGLCVMCNKMLQTDNYFKDDFCCIDHLIPRTKNGKNKISNLFPICRSCNCSKNNKNTNDIILDLINSINNINSKRFLNVFRYENNHNPDSVDFIKLKNDFILLINTIDDKKETLIKEFNSIRTA